MVIGEYTKSQKSGSSNNVITLTSYVTTQYDGTNYTAFAKTTVAWTLGSLGGNEKITVSVFNAATNALITSTEYTLTSGNCSNYTKSLNYTYPASKKIYIQVALDWNASTKFSVTSGVADLSPVGFTNIEWSDVTATSATANVTVDRNCDLFQWSRNNSTWTTISGASGSTASVNITGLTAATANTLYFRARRADLGNYGTTSSAVTTNGDAVLESVSTVKINQVSPSVTITATVYDTSYGYDLGVIVNGTVIATDIPVAFSATGVQTKSVSLTNYADDICAAMPNTAITTATYVLTTIRQGAGDGSSKGGVIYVDEATSKPIWSNPSIYYVDSESEDFLGTTDVETGGVISNATTIGANVLNLPYAQNGASIAYYYLRIGGAETRSSSRSFSADVGNISGDTVDITYGVVDSRGFETNKSITVPVYQYTPIYWSATNITRDNGYDNDIVFDVEATWCPFTATVSGASHTNTTDGKLTCRYKVGSGSWTTLTPDIQGTVSGSTITYNGTPISGGATPNTANVLIELTASDSLSSSTLSLTVPSGLPLIQIIDGKVIINGDLQVNGTIINNVPVVMPVKGDIVAIDMNGDGMAENYRVLNITDTVAELVARYSPSSSTFASSGQTYAGNALDTYLNSTWYNTLSNTAKSAIVDKTFRQDRWWRNSNGSPVYKGTYDVNSNCEVSLENASFGAEITRHIYELSVQDIIDYLGVTSSMSYTESPLNKTNLLAIFGFGSGTYTFLRSASCDTTTYAMLVNGDTGRISYGACTSAYSAYPAFKIDLSQIGFTIV